MLVRGLMLPAIVASGLLGGPGGQYPTSEESSVGVVERVTQQRPAETGINAPGAGPVEPTDALLAEIEQWLKVHFDLSPGNRRPTVAIVSATDILFLRYKAFTEERRREVLASYARGHGRSVTAMYDPRTATIYLAEGWTGRTPAEMSILVHEMVHHLQTEARLSYACPEESEKLAYAAQEKWLGQSGRSLESEFGLDGFTLLAASICVH